MSDRDEASAPTDEAPPRPVFLNEDWLAAVAGLVILGLALLGLIPKAVLW